MDDAKLLECLARDYARLRDLAGRDLTAAVPSCPGWTVADLVFHVAKVYLHKAEVMRHGEWPDPWPPGFGAEPPLEALARGYSQVTAEFAAREPGEPALTFYRPDQSVRFWIRRMALETVIHRVDAELALGEPIDAIPVDLALDGIDEVLQIFVGYRAQEWAEDFASVLAGSVGHRVAVEAGGAEWVIETNPDGLAVTFATGAAAPGRAGASGVGAGEPDAVVRGPADAVLLWLWARGGEGVVEAKGDPAALADLRSLLVSATQ